MLPFCLVILTAVVLAAGTDCPDRWMPYGGSCYLFGHDHVHFTEAEEYCRHHNAHLVEVESAGENAFLKDYMRDLTPDNYWLGMTDEIVEGVWKWYHSGTNVSFTGEIVEGVWKWYHSGTDVSFTDWGPGEPQNNGPTPGEDCAVINKGFVWADVVCTFPGKALCELRSGSCTDFVG